MAQQLVADAEDPDFIRFLALVERDGEVVPAGYGFFENLRSARPVLGIAVADAFQELGLGQAIMQHLKAVARQLDKKRIILTVDGDNVRAQHVYAKMGFTMTRLIPGSSLQRPRDGVHPVDKRVDDRDSVSPESLWIPAFAGMTRNG